MAYDLIPSPLQPPDPWDPSTIAEASQALGVAPGELAGYYARSGGWVIDSLDLAEWAMRKLAEAQADLAELRAQRDEWVRRVQDAHRANSQVPEATVAFMEAALAQWGIAQRTERRKTVATPSGRIATTATGPALEVRDEAALLSWILQLPLHATTNAELEAAVAWEAVVKVERSVLVSKVPAGIALEPGLVVRFACPGAHGEWLVQVPGPSPDSPRWRHLDGPHYVAEPSVGEVRVCEACTAKVRAEVVADVEAEAMADWPEGAEPDAELVVEAAYPVLAVEPIHVAMWQGAPVPGLGVRPGKVTAKVHAS